MRWRDLRRSSNVEDRRGIPGGGLALGGAAGIIVVVVALLMGADPRQLLEQIQTSTDTPATTQPRPPAENELADFVSVVLAETEDVWTAQFRADGKEYTPPTLVLFTERVESACGMAGAAMGPFYCPGDSKVYIDLSFYDLLRDRLGAPGDFAQAYVIAHEVGHHVQNLLGISERVQRMRSGMTEEEYNQVSVRMELQADFLAGVWAHHTQKMRQVLEEGDLEEAITAAGAVGDDRLQKESGGTVVPDSFTHGTSAQRVRWFRLGYETGDMRQGDTFNARNL
jgi:predicted metalloprotease